MSPFFFLFWRQQNKYFGYKRPPHPAPLHPPGPAACLPPKAIPFVGQGGSFAAPPAAAPSRSRSPTSRGHPPRAACALPAVAAHLPPTCRAGVHARRDPAQPGTLPVRPPALPRMPHPLPLLPPGLGAYLPPTCRAGVHACRDPAPPGNLPVRLPALLRTPHPLPPCSPPAPAACLPPACRAGVHTRRDPAPLCSPGSPAAPGLVPHPNTPTRRRHARLHDIHPSQPTIGDHPGKRS